ncbi:DUF3299 domain-containing protein [Parasphingopyxis sp.]|uniref:DUF3299 domain-containing protein n=1 Tax=Parasphingopyxis sp. TaxID=1920299 RepID=UPI00262DF221|nr:DUF3299 domain-containing protein [Parasphingopyxis sp.]
MPLFAKLIAVMLATASILFVSVETAEAQQHGIWRPAETPRGGVAWSLLESTRVIDRRGENNMIYSRPEFPSRVRALNGRTVRVAGWMMPLQNSARQSHFVLLAYPPGCPFHLHALPNQFIEVRTSTPIPVEEMDAITLTGTLRLTGRDESGIFYRLINARQIGG